jgi:hypothetical protein
MSLALVVTLVVVHKEVKSKSSFAHLPSMLTTGHVNRSHDSEDSDDDDGDFSPAATMTRLYRPDRSVTVHNDPVSVRVDSSCPTQ